MCAQFVEKKWFFARVFSIALSWAECNSHKLDFVQKCQSLRYYIEENENNGETREIFIFFHLQFRIPYGS